MTDEPLNERDIKHDSFSALLDQCLRLDDRKDELLVIYDESFFPYYDALLEIIQEREISATFLFLPYTYQRFLIERARSSRGGDSLQLPRCMGQAIFASTVILNVLSGAQETVAVRAAVLDQGRPSDNRLAHIPGIDLHILGILSKTPFPEIERSSELLAWALGEAREVEILTYDVRGAEYCLKMNLEGWDNEPIMSPGVIAPGGWGNVPPGETYCCPNPCKVKGTICINGSVPEHVMTEGEEVLLTFEQGELKVWQGDPLRPSHAFFEKQQRKAIERRDENWNILAELGIGLNPSITKLTGNSLFDEKALRTIHIAIGSNISFGHHVKSAIHADLLTWLPSLLLDGRVIMERGDLRLDDLERFRNDLQVAPLNIRPKAKIFIREGKVEETQDGRLKRVLAKANRVGYVVMAGPERSHLLASLARELNMYGDIEFGEFIRQHPAFDGVPTPVLLALLDHYRVLGFSGISSDRASARRSKKGS